MDEKKERTLEDKINAGEWELVEAYRALPVSDKTALINKAWKLCADNSIPIIHHQDNL